MINQLASTATSSSTHEAVHDYRIAYLSRQLSIVAHREVHSGRAKFGAFGDGKEVAQVALARAFRPGDWRAGYYRDQTLMLALGLLTPSGYFAQLYAHTDTESDPATGGRSMLGHYGVRLLDDNGVALPQIDRYNSSADISPTAGQMPRLVGLAYASRLYREVPELHHMTAFSDLGGEVAFGTIGNASCAEGLFWESINAIGVLRAPAVVSIWDDGYGISVPNEMQLIGGNLTVLLDGFRLHSNHEPGYQIYRVPGWDYPQLLNAFLAAAEQARTHHIPAIVHVVEMTQPQGHSTSGSHERYKSPERMAFEREYDPIDRMRAWLIREQLASERELADLERTIAVEVQTACEAEWERFSAGPRRAAAELADLLDVAAIATSDPEILERMSAQLRAAETPLYRHVLEAASAALRQLHNAPGPARAQLIEWKEQVQHARRRVYATHLYSESDESPLQAPVQAPIVAADAPEVYGFDVLRANFDALMAHDPRICVFGEDVGRLGDVNRGLAGLQAKYGELRVSDTGIREATIIGQGIGLALRGLRPIAELQYLDYVLYALATLSDDLACLRWRTAGGQKAPLIIRTRGHRLEGIWHAGSPMAALLDLLRGVHILVPRNMTQAAGFYNTLLRGDDPGIVIEVLNGYRLRELLPSNLGDFTVPLGVPEVLREGKDITLVTYGACCTVAQQAAVQLAEVGIEVEIIDVQSLLPFDINDQIAASLQKTSRLVVLDEDMPGGASAFILQQVLEREGGYQLLDSPPCTIAAAAHRPAYGTDGDYFSKPNAEQIFEVAFRMMHEAEPRRWPLLF